MNGGPGGTRSHDLGLKRPLLFLLSYRSKDEMAGRTGVEPVRSRIDSPVHQPLCARPKMVEGVGVEPIACMSRPVCPAGHERLDVRRFLDLLLQMQALNR